MVLLTYNGVAGTATLMPSKELISLMRNPLLRSAGVLNGLFYAEINERLLLEGKGRGARNCLFLNAQNKQTVQLILRLLRRLGISAAAIVDIDIVKEGGSVWSEFLGSCNVPATTTHSLAIARAELLSMFSVTGKNMKRDGGILLLSGGNLNAANDLFDSLDAYGLFVVRRGEVESWLASLELGSRHGPNWLIPVFEKLGEDPSDSKFIKAGNGDVWDFLRKIAAWLTDPSKKGILP